MVYQKVIPKFQLSAVLFILLAAVSLMLSGCAVVEQPMDSIRAVSQGIIASTRKQGEKMVRTPEKTKEKYTCVPYHKRMLKLEEMQILPDLVTPGKEINQRIQYAFCPFAPSETLKGSITRTVLFNRNEMFRDTTAYEFKPGTWMIDVFIGIPKEAQSGVYALNITLQYGNETLKGRSSFIVKGQ
jgi:hypothetical protein